MDELVEPLHSPTTTQPESLDCEDYADIDSHRILSIGGKPYKFIYWFMYDMYSLLRSFLAS